MQPYVTYQELSGTLNSSAEITRHHRQSLVKSLLDTCNLHKMDYVIFPSTVVLLDLIIVHKKISYKSYPIYAITCLMIIEKFHYHDDQMVSSYRRILPEYWHSEQKILECEKKIFHLLKGNVNVDVILPIKFPNDLFYKIYCLFFTDIIYAKYSSRDLVKYASDLKLCPLELIYYVRDFPKITSSIVNSEDSDEITIREKLAGYVNSEDSDKINIREKWVGELPELLIKEDYRKIEKISKSEYSKVYRSKRVDSDEKIYIVKKLTTYDSRYGIDYSHYRECSFLAFAKHPAIITVLAVNWNMLLLETMDFNIEEYLTHNYGDEGIPDTGVQIEILKQIFCGIQHLHGLQIMHRDLKTANILISIKDDSTKIVKIADFGTATFFDDKNPNFINLSMAPCTYYVSAPELLLDKIDYTAKVDIWSLGIITYRIATRKHLISAIKSKNGCLKGVYTIFGQQPYKLPANHIADSRIKEIIDKCLQFEPQSRPDIFDLSSIL